MVFDKVIFDEVTDSALNLYNLNSTFFVFWRAALQWDFLKDVISFQASGMLSDLFLGASDVLSPKYPVCTSTSSTTLTSSQSNPQKRDIKQFMLQISQLTLQLTKEGYLLLLK